MIDYWGHAAVLDNVRVSLTNLNEPELTAQRDRLIAAANANPNSLLLGAFIDHLIVHAVSDGVEIEFLESAASLWRRGLALYDKISTVRNDIETALAHPSAVGATDKFNQ